VHVYYVRLNAGHAYKIHAHQLQQQQQWQRQQQRQQQRKMPLLQPLQFSPCMQELNAAKQDQQHAGVQCNNAAQQQARDLDTCTLVSCQCCCCAC
jgi:hypothetical protein